MTAEEKFLQALKSFAQVPKMVIPGTVIKVDIEGKTCDVRPLDGGAPFLSVKLKPTKTSKSGFWMIPSIDSSVLVSRINNNDNMTYVAMMSDIDQVVFLTAKSSFRIDGNGEIAIESDGSRIRMTKTGLEFNGGQLGGIPVSKSIAARFNIIESDLNSLKSAISGLLAPFTANPGNPVLGANLSALAPYAGVPAVATTEEDLANPKIKQ